MRYWLFSKAQMVTFYELETLNEKKSYNFKEMSGVGRKAKGI